MDRDAIKDVLKDVFGRNFFMVDQPEWVSMRCPLSHWTHERGQDGNPSAGVSVQPTGMSIFSCFTCKNKSPFSTMLKKYADFSGEDLADLIEELEEGEYLGPRSLPSWDSIGAALQTEVLMPIPEGIYMGLYDSAAGHPYLKDRGISDTTARKLELLFDPKDPADNEPRILFPVRGPDGQLYGFSGRATSPKARLKVRDYAGLVKKELILGSHFDSIENPKSIILVEGLFDYASMHEMGYCGMAAMHSTLTEAQAAILQSIAKPLYVFYDKDKAGQDGVKIVGDRLRKYMPVMKVRYPQVQIEDGSDQGWHWLKDPGELTPEEVADMVADARFA